MKFVVFEKQSFKFFGSDSPAVYFKSALVPRLRAFHFHRVYFTAAPLVASSVPANRLHIYIKVGRITPLIVFHFHRFYLTEELLLTRYSDSPSNLRSANFRSLVFRIAKISQTTFFERKISNREFFATFCGQKVGAQRPRAKKTFKCKLHIVYCLNRIHIILNNSSMLLSTFS
ncbi:hypothetical protein SAMN06297358_3297 [Pedobacter xixiisoli]|uniref:Uncharacterized protein n=1 Tax=Pedobacter xixiisoli TaxID=1476464 RepID=A0A286ACG3_9SPHI|nr:hypothetical protein SAMN06297358_3297 [Pedobacter xixiisoli]